MGADSGDPEIGGSSLPGSPFGGVCMVVACPVCHEDVHTSCGVIVFHGSKSRGYLVSCAGSGSPVSSVLDCCA